MLRPFSHDGVLFKILTSQWAQIQACSSCGLLGSFDKTPNPPAFLDMGCCLQHTFCITLLVLLESKSASSNVVVKQHYSNQYSFV